MTASPPAPADRLAWLDATKGACIVLVVLHHVVTKYLPSVTPDHWEVVADGWLAVCMFLKPVRMPVFFAISGFFAASAIRRPWPQSARRAAGSYYLYLVWLACYAVFYRFESSTDANRTDDWGDLVGELLWAETSMWFLYALAVYFVLAKVLAGAPPVAVLGAATALALWTGWSGIEENNKASVLAHFVFYAAGAYFPHLVRAAGNLSRHALIALGGGYAVVVTGTQAAGLPFSVTLVGGGALGIPFGLGLLSRLGSGAAPATAMTLTWLGTRTLRVYVLHFAVIGVLFHVTLPWTFTDPAGALFLVVLPLLATALVTGVCLLGYELAFHHGGRHLFTVHPSVDRTAAALVAPRATVRGISWSEVARKVREACWQPLSDPDEATTRR